MWYTTFKNHSRRRKFSRRSNIHLIFFFLLWKELTIVKFISLKPTPNIMLIKSTGQSVKHLWKTVWRLCFYPYYVVIPFQNVYFMDTETLIQKDICASMFSWALRIIARVWKWSKRPTDEWLLIQEADGDVYSQWNTT